MSVITNTTVISNFACIDQLELLRQLYTPLYISTEVFGEIQDGLGEGYTFYAAIERLVYPLHQDGWLHLTGMSGDKELRIFSEMPPHLHAGESSCIAVAQNRGWLFLSDDLAARKNAKQRNIRISGTIGCLVLAVEHKLCDIAVANELLQQMVHQGFHSPVMDLIPLLRNR